MLGPPGESLRGLPDVSMYLDSSCKGLRDHSWTPPATGCAINDESGPSSDCSHISGLVGERIRSGP
jgi:hypothetical protein